jgi:alkyl sulfatase BDS1-like metallo-beta-lactamase superfamily hydrolase
MGDVLDLAERFWRGEVPRRDLWRPTGKHEELVPGLVFFHIWANVTALRTEAGLVLVDTGNFAARDRTFSAVRAVDPAPVAAAVYTHGHVDHACGLPPFLAEAREKKWPEPCIIAHRNVAARFDRYRMTAPWNGRINSRQFSRAATWPTVIRNIWRLYGGWWDGRPAHLKPAREAEIGREVASLAGGIDTLLARARALAAEGRLDLASHLVDWAAAAAPKNWAVHEVRADVYLARAQNSEALMTRGIFSEAARESAIKAGRPFPEHGAGP